MAGKNEQRAPRPFWRKHFFKLTTLPLGIAALIWFFGIQPRITHTVDEAFPTAAPARAVVTQPAASASGAVAVKSGDFVKVEHDGSGKATIFKQADGTFILRLENLDI